VGDPTSQDPDAFKALRPQKFVFKRLLLGEIGIDDENGFCLRIVKQSPTTLHENFFAPLVDLAQFTGPFTSVNGGSTRLDGRDRIDKKQVVGALANDLRTGPSIKSFSAFVQKRIRLFRS